MSQRVSLTVLGLTSGARLRVAARYFVLGFG